MIRLLVPMLLAVLALASPASGEAVNLVSVEVQLRGFCGQWSVVPVGRGKVTTPKGCPRNKATKLIEGNCTVHVEAGPKGAELEYELALKANQHRTRVRFKVRKDGTLLHVSGPIRVEKRRIVLQTTQLTLDRANYAGVVSFEYVGHASHPNKDCRDPANPVRLRLPSESRYLLTGDRELAVIVLNPRTPVASERPTTVATVGPEALKLRTSKIQVIPTSKKARRAKWTVLPALPAERKRRKSATLWLIHGTPYLLDVEGTVQQMFLITWQGKVRVADRAVFKQHFTIKRVR